MHAHMPAAATTFDNAENFLPCFDRNVIKLCSAWEGV